MAAIASSDLDEVVDATEDVFRELRGARLFLTGATGFYGVWLLSALAHAQRRLGFRIPATVLTRDPEGARGRHGAILEGIELLQGDTRTFAIPEGSFTHVVHGATSSTAQLDPSETVDIIVGGARRALEVAAKSGAKRFLLMSSGAVYGPQPAELTHIPESYVPKKRDVANAYAEGKRTAEELARTAARTSDLTVAIARGFAFVGPHLPLDAHFAIGNFLRDALAGGPIRILGDGTPYRSYMYGSDLATWMWTLLVRGSDATNVGSGDGRPLREIAERVAHARKVDVDVAKTAPPDHVPSRYVPNVALAKSDLGLEIRVPLDEAIRRTIAFHAK